MDRLLALSMASMLSSAPGAREQDVASKVAKATTLADQLSQTGEDSAKDMGIALQGACETAIYALDFVKMLREPDFNMTKSLFEAGVIVTVSALFVGLPLADVMSMVNAIADKLKEDSDRCVVVCFCLRICCCVSLSFSWS
jgi:hypothetical protein